VWRLERLSDDQTSGRIDESMDGFLLSLFYSSKELEETDRRCLEREGGE